MAPLNFAKLQNLEAVLLHLQCSPEIIYDILRHPERHYTPLTIPKKGKAHTPRRVYKLSNDLRRIQRTIALGLRSPVMQLSEHVQGFRKDRSIVSNARPHCGHQSVVTADIEDFFDAITFDQVMRIFTALGCAAQASLTLARLCTLKDKLPQGARTSPALANLATQPLDKAIVAAWPTTNYTRYADDLAFSGGQLPSETELSSILQDFNFTLKKGSYKRQQRNAGQRVTGLNVTDSTPSIPRRIRRKINRHMRFCLRYGITAHLTRLYRINPSSDEIKSFRDRLYGRIVSWGRVEPDQQTVWLDQFKELED